ncbi:hypothetical protein T07_2371 [Trichinella nelsoni]|uniref:Uncharacterized protein n=1 Tax=Trichinella nelsoni TaxID=6336 RepID=A0A0V0SMS2_9BILA|nr:hypothetical protein T07_2371 [Trichinella nelsoni]
MVLICGLQCVSLRTYEYQRLIGLHTLVKRTNEYERLIERHHEYKLLVTLLSLVRSSSYHFCGFLPVFLCNNVR